MLMLAAFSLSIHGCSGVGPENGALVREEDLAAAADADARVLWDEAQAMEEEGDFSGALDRYEDLIDDYPDSSLASSAQFRIGVCLEEEDELYDAFEAYQTLLDDYPGKGNLGEILKRQYEIGEAFLNGRRRYVLFFRIWSGLGCAEEIFRTVVNNATFSRVSPRSQYSLGRALQMQGDYEEAITEYNQVLTNYPGTDVIPPALFNLGICYYEETMSADYDSKTGDKAIRYLKKFIKRFPDNSLRSESEEKIVKLIDLKAKKAYSIAVYYEGLDSPEGARIFYQEILDRYPDSSYAVPAREKLAALSETKAGETENREVE